MTKAQIRKAAETGEILEEKEVGRYKVQVYLYKGFENDITPVYRVMLDGVKVPCMTRSEERRFPKRPAWAGHYMVREWAARLGLEKT